MYRDKYIFLNFAPQKQNPRSPLSYTFPLNLPAAISSRPSSSPRYLHKPSPQHTPEIFCLITLQFFQHYLFLDLTTIIGSHAIISYMSFSFNYNSSLTISDPNTTQTYFSSINKAIFLSCVIGLIFR